TYTQSYSEIENADLVIEAATEDLEIKKGIFNQVEETVGKNVMITSNTSSIPAKRIFSDLENPERTSITHFFAPAWRNPAVEIIKWDGSSRETVEYLYWMFCLLGKLPLIVEDEIAFMLDRVFDNWCNESAHLLDEATASQIDGVAEEFSRTGPFYTLNLADGNKIIVKSNNLKMEENEVYEPNNIFHSVAEWDTKEMGEDIDVPEKISEKVRNRLLGIVTSQSCNIVDREIGTPADLNLGCQVALGFRKGPFDIIKSLGKSRINEALDVFLEERKGMPAPQHDLPYYQDFYRHIITDQINGVKIITIRRPHVRNILNDELTDEILEAMKEEENNPDLKGFVITGYGPDVFSGGAEIDKFSDLLGKFDDAVKYAKDFSELFRYIDRSEKPIIAALNGYALGGGLELALRCHRIIASEDVWLQFPEVTLGIVPGVGGMVVPYRRWGKEASSTFNDMIRFSKKLKADEATDIGLISEFAESYRDLIDKAVTKVNELAGKEEKLDVISDEPVEIEVPQPVEDPRAKDQPLSKEVDKIACETIEKAAKAESFEEALQVGYEGFAKTACTDAAKEGVTAFQKGETPDLRNPLSD
ncbi:hypothetical protein AKJ61_03360, partial [candidate division MSBL1 archaeon SCGC-AAA259B11]